MSAILILSILINNSNFQLNALKPCRLMYRFFGVCESIVMYFSVHMRPKMRLCMAAILMLFILINLSFFQLNAWYI